REVYRHPEDSTKCLKIVIQDNARDKLGDEETLREQAYYSTLIKRGISWGALPQFYGNIDTNLGTAAIFDLVCDHDGSVANTLEYYLSRQELTQQNLSGLSQAMKNLKTTLIADSIVTMTIKPKNIRFPKNV
ncbi:MAG: YrbL family protein, partial [Sinobacterium sp.]